MGAKKLPCLGKFATHYCEPWWWDSKKELYYRECSLMGCRFSETANQLSSIGRTAFVGKPGKHKHDWDVWKTTGDQTGLYIPPWLYKRECKDCKVRQMAKNLEKD